MKKLFSILLLTPLLSLASVTSVMSFQGPWAAGIYKLTPIQGTNVNLAPVVTESSVTYVLVDNVLAAESNTVPSSLTTRWKKIGTN